MRKIYFDLVSGASGDMVLSALVDLGLSVDHLNTQLQLLGLDGVSVTSERTRRSGLSCTKISISGAEATSHRHLPQILDIIRGARYSETVTRQCEAIMTRIAQAEAKVHDIPLERVHFHEIGAVDTIVDIVGVCVGLEYLGIQAVEFSDLSTGRGTVRCEHGLLPVPAPATAEMMKGFAVRSLDIEAETLTPTGCAILTTIGHQSRAVPAGTVVGMGYGCGERVFEGLPNVLRAFMIETESSPNRDRIWVLESDMDHLSGEVMSYVAQQLMDAGALDVSWSAVFMKKGRPGYRLTVLCTGENRQRITDLVLTESRSLGVRFHEVERIIADRASSTASVMGTDLAIKDCSYGNMRFSKPEFDSLAALARQQGRPVLEVAEEYIRSNKQ